VGRVDTARSGHRVELLGLWKVSRRSRGGRLYVQGPLLNGAVAHHLGGRHYPDRTESDELTGNPQRRDVGTSDPLLLTPEEAAEALRIGRTTLYALLKGGEVRPVHIGRSCRISRAELERYVQRLQAPPPPRAPRKRHSGLTTNQAELFEVVHTPPDAS